MRFWGRLLERSCSSAVLVKSPFSCCCWSVGLFLLSIWAFPSCLELAMGSGHFLCTSPGVSSPDPSHFCLPHSLLVHVHPEPLCCSCPCFYSLDCTFLINTDQFTALEFIMHHPFLLTSYQNFQQFMAETDCAWPSLGSEVSGTLCCCG